MDLNSGERGQVERKLYTVSLTDRSQIRICDWTATARDEREATSHAFRAARTLWLLTQGRPATQADILVWEVLRLHDLEMDSVQSDWVCRSYLMPKSKPAIRFGFDEASDTIAGLIAGDPQGTVATIASLGGEHPARAGTFANYCANQYLSGYSGPLGPVSQVTAEAVACVAAATAIAIAATGKSAWQSSFRQDRSATLGAARAAGALRDRARSAKMAIAKLKDLGCDEVADAYAKHHGIDA